MKFGAAIIALAATLLPAVLGAPTPAADLKIRNIEARDVVPDSYIVVLKSDLADEDYEASINTASHIVTKRAPGSGRKHRGVGAKYKLGNFKGYQIDADSATIGEIAASPEVCTRSNNFGVPTRSCSNPKRFRSEISFTTPQFTS